MAEITDSQVLLSTGRFSNRKYHSDKVQESESLVTKFKKGKVILQNRKVVSLD